MSGHDWSLVAIKRSWIPEWVFRIYAHVLPPWVQPFRWIMTKKVEEEEA